MRSIFTKERTAPLVCDVDVSGTTLNVASDETSEASMTSEASSDATVGRWSRRELVFASL